MNKFIAAAPGVLAATIAVAASAGAQNFPDRAIKIIVPYPERG